MSTIFGMISNDIILSLIIYAGFSVRVHEDGTNVTCDDESVKVANNRTLESERVEVK